MSVANKKHHGKGYGRDGMVVLTVVTRKAVPRSVHQNKQMATKELYAFVLENRLIQLRKLRGVIFLCISGSPQACSLR